MYRGRFESCLLERGGPSKPMEEDESLDVLVWSTKTENGAETHQVRVQDELDNKERKIKETMIQNQTLPAPKFSVHPMASIC